MPTSPSPTPGHPPAAELPGGPPVPVPPAEPGAAAATQTGVTAAGAPTSTTWPAANAGASTTWPPATTAAPSQHAPPRRRDRLRADLGASVVVFLVAVPLSLGIALASGAPLLAGLVAAVVGGIVAGLLGGSPLQVSGPAAGLTVVVAELVGRFGWAVTCLVTVGAGVLQLVFGLARVARFAQAVPPAVVHGMLAGIGITIAAAQLHVVIGGSPQAAGVANLVALPAALGAADAATVLVGAVATGLLLVWPRLPARLRAVPGPLVAVLAATLVAAAWPTVARVELPGGLLDSLAGSVTSTLTAPSLLPSGQWAGVAAAMLTVALVASVESLLSASAVDRMHAGPRTRADRELLGQGAANVVSGLAGGLPVTGVILRSAANVAAGARTRAATVLHGVWIAVFGIALVGLVEQIPLAALAGLLVTVGAGLVRRADVASARSHGELPAYLATAAGVLVWGLLTGVGIGLAVAGLSVLARVLRCRIVLDEGRDGGPVRIAVGGVVSFLSVPRLARVLAAVAPGADVRMDIGTYYLDHAAREHLDGWTARHRRDGGVVELHREPSAPRAADLAPVVSAPAGRDPAPPVPSPVPTAPGRSCPAGRPETASTRPADPADERRRRRSAWVVRGKGR